MLRSLRYGFRRLIKSDRAERELSDEVQHLLDLTVEDYMARGLPRHDAERRARLDFGSVESVKEAHRSTGWDAAIESVRRDATYACRGMVRNPVFAIVVIATLALGIGATTAMFSVLNAVLLRPLPYADAGRLALLWTNDLKRSLPRESTSYLTISDWQDSNHSFDDIAYFSVGRATVGTGPTGERTRAATVSGNMFQVLGVAPALGRAIANTDANTPNVAMISHELWQRRFNGDPAIIGKPLVVDEWQGKGGADQLTIIGVTPPGFYFPDRGTSIWVPATAYWRWNRDSSERFQSWARRWTGVARLRGGVSIDDARKDMAGVGDRLARAYPSDLADFPGYAVSVVPMLDSIVGIPLQRGLWLLMAAVGLVLLVACANIANLLLARGAARQPEFAMRRALGASRGRLLRQQLIESLVLAAAGGSVGLAMAAGLNRIITARAAQRVPRLDENAIDGPVLLFALAVSIASVCVFGMFPALRATNADRFKVTRPRGVMLVGECALAVVVLVAAGLLLRSLVLVRAVDPGFDPSRVALIRIQFPNAGVESNGSTGSDSERALRREQTQQVLLERVAGLSGVAAAAFVDDMFVSGEGNKSIAFPGTGRGDLRAGQLNNGSVSPDFFAAMRVPLLAGRYLRRDDTLLKIRALWAPQQSREWSLDEKARRAVAEPVVVNDAFVKRYLAGRDPIGQRFCIDPTAKTYWYEIVGVVGDMHRQGLERVTIPEYFGPFIAGPSGRVDLVVRTRANALAAMPEVKQAIASVVPAASIPQTSLAASDLAAFSAQRELQTLLLTSFAALALFLAAIGIYGVVHYSVAQRTREIGVRIAIGARPRDVFARVMVDGVRLPLIGVAIGLVAALSAASLLAHQLFGVTTSDLVTFSVVPLTLLLTAGIASFGPAKRASRIDAVKALRAE